MVCSTHLFDKKYGSNIEIMFTANRVGVSPFLYNSFTSHIPLTVHDLGQTVHGGLIMSLTDTLGSLAVASKGHWMTGVSTDIATSFVRPSGRVGDIVNVKASVIGMGEHAFFAIHDCIGYLRRYIGKSLAYTRVEFSNPAGELVAYGRTLSFCNLYK